AASPSLREHPHILFPLTHTSASIRDNLLASSSPRGASASTNSVPVVAASTCVASPLPLASLLHLTSSSPEAPLPPPTASLSLPSPTFSITRKQVLALSNIKLRLAINEEAHELFAIDGFLFNEKLDNLVKDVNMGGYDLLTSTSTTSAVAME
ncbi:hypothetical protein HN51_005193, partial [Arachis hypogaea]